jgi:hypothetical protein
MSLEIPREAEYSPLDPAQLAANTLGAPGEFHQPSAEFIDARVEKALAESPFQQSPELADSFKTYYETQYALDGLITDTLNNELPSDPEQKATLSASLEAVIQSSHLPLESIQEVASSIINSNHEPSLYAQATGPVLASIRLARLQDPESKQLQRAELTAASAALESLFAEPSVMVTSVGQEDIERIKAAHDVLAQKITESGLFNKNGRAMDLDHGSSLVDHLKDNPAYMVDRARQLFWDDSRFAGQLLFHDTNRMDKIWSEGALLPRRMQQEKYGEFTTQNKEYDGDRLHSPTPHWTEDYDINQTYRGKDQQAQGTIAMPLAEIIKYAPFARDAQYGTLKLKAGAEADIIPQVTVHDTIGYVTGGTSDAQGRFGLDRTFYQSAHDVAPDAPLESAPDGYRLPLDETSTWVQLGKEKQKQGKLYGTGEHFPDQVVINIKEDPDSDKGMFDLSPRLSLDEKLALSAANTAITAHAVKEMQHMSISKYGNELVVPLRSGVMNFYVVDDGMSKLKPQAEFMRQLSLA